jgi:tRNA uridine 5-carboxymethylaminomethyl modification enzyme
VRFSKKFKQLNGKGFSLYQLLARPENSYNSLLEQYPDAFHDHGQEINQQLELSVKFAGYIKREKIEISRLDNLESTAVPEDFNFMTVVSLRTEAREKLSRIHPLTLAQCSRVPGISPADISVLMVALARNRKAS